MRAEDASRLRRAVGRLARELNRSAAVEGLTPSQASTLGAIVRRGPIGLAELADIEGLNPTMVSRVIRNLTDAGLIQRVPGESDLRRASVRVTARGTAVDKRIRAARDAIVFDCVARLEAAQADAITVALPALEALVDELHTRTRTRPAR